MPGAQASQASQESLRPGTATGVGGGASGADAGTAEKSETHRRLSRPPAAHRPITSARQGWRSSPDSLQGHATPAASCS
ncbi:hypothetical protein ANO11243_049060 [Dothideomycetidae sp. 11243]|nr:hypothetical protein ANO11243_049060 [fungal sp. No.11243]